MPIITRTRPSVKRSTEIIDPAFLLSEWDDCHMPELMDPRVQAVLRYRSEYVRRRTAGKTVPRAFLLHWRDAEKKANSWWWECCIGRFPELIRADWESLYPGMNWVGPA